MALGAVTLLVAAGLVGLWAPDRAAASCVGPQVAVAVGAGTPSVVSESAAPVEVRPGDRLRVTGEWFHTGCEDTQPGCSGPPASDREAPMQDVRLSLEQGTWTRQLGVVSAGSRAQRYAVSYDVTVPATVAPGAATLRVGPVGVPLVVAG